MAAANSPPQLALRHCWVGRRLVVLVVVALLLGSCDQIPSTGSIDEASNEGVSESNWRVSREGGGAWIAAYFNESDDPCFAGMDSVRRWRRERAAGSDPLVEEGLRLAFSALTTASPQGLNNPLRDVALELRSARLSDGFLELNFSDAFQEAGANGTSDGCAKASTFFATVHHYYPQARSVCLLVEGEDPISDALFHDVVSGCSEYKRQSALVNLHALRGGIKFHESR